MVCVKFVGKLLEMYMNILKYKQFPFESKIMYNVQLSTMALKNA